MVEKSQKSAHKSLKSVMYYWVDSVYYFTVSIVTKEDNLDGVFSNVGLSSY